MLDALIVCVERPLAKIIFVSIFFSKKAFGSSK
jgi:hypothetical protein